MVKIASKIFHSLILLVVGVALIGVNVNKLYCSHCEVAYLQVKMMPEDKPCCCQHGCSCCQKHGNTAIACHPELQHSFYKVTDSSQAEESMGIAVLFFYLDKYEIVVPEVFPLPEHIYFSDPEDYPDNPPSPELLCTYRC